MGQQHIAILDNLLGGAKGERKKRWGPAKKERWGKTQDERDGEQVGFPRPNIMKAQQAVNEAMNANPQIQQAARALFAREKSKARAQKAVDGRAGIQKAARDALKKNKQKRGAVAQRAVNARYGDTVEEQMVGPAQRAAERINKKASDKGLDRFARRIVAKAERVKVRKPPTAPQDRVTGALRTAKPTTLEPERAATVAKKQKEKRADTLKLTRGEPKQQFEIKKLREKYEGIDNVKNILSRKNRFRPYDTPSRKQNRDTLKLTRGEPKQEFEIKKLRDKKIDANVKKILSASESKKDVKVRAVKSKLEPGKRGDQPALRKKNRAVTQNRKRVTKAADGEHVYENTNMQGAEDEDDIVTGVVTAADRTAAAKAAAEQLSESEDEDDIVQKVVTKAQREAEAKAAAEELLSDDEDDSIEDGFDRPKPPPPISLEQPILDDVLRVKTIDLTSDNEDPAIKNETPGEEPTKPGPFKPVKLEPTQPGVQGGEDQVDDETPVVIKRVKVEPPQRVKVESPPPGVQGGDDDMSEDSEDDTYQDAIQFEAPVVEEPMNIDNPPVAPPENIFEVPIQQGAPTPPPAQPQPPTVGQQVNNAAVNPEPMDIPSVQNNNDVVQQRDQRTMNVITSQQNDLGGLLPKLYNLVRSLPSLSQAARFDVGRGISQDPDLQQLVTAGKMKWSDILTDDIGAPLVSFAKLKNLISKLEKEGASLESTYNRTYAKFVSDKTRPRFRKVGNANIWQGPRWLDSEF